MELPEGMSSTAGLNLISEFLAGLAKERYAAENEGPTPTKEEVKVANKYSDAEFRERVCNG